MSIDEAFARHKQAEQEQADEVAAPRPKSITGRFEIFVPVDSKKVEERLRAIEGIDEIFRTPKFDIAEEGGDVQHIVYSFDVEDAYELGPVIHNTVIEIGEMLGVENIYCTWHAVTGVRW